MFRILGQGIAGASELQQAAVDLQSKMPAGRKIKDKLLKGLVYAAGIAVCLILLFIIGYIFYRGLPGITAEFLTTQSSYVHNTIGILPNILNTLYIVLIAMVIVIPLGVCAVGK